MMTWVLVVPPKEKVGVAWDCLHALTILIDSSDDDMGVSCAAHRKGGCGLGLFACFNNFD